MPVNRGDIILAFVEDVGSTWGKVRPALVVQSDRNNARLKETIIAAITSNTSRVSESHQVSIDLATPDGAATGLLHTSAVRCERLHTIPQSDIRRVIGRLSGALVQQVNASLRASLGL